MDFAEQVRILGLSNIQTFEPYISQIRLFSLLFNYAKPRIMRQIYFTQGVQCSMICGLNLAIPDT